MPAAAVIPAPIRYIKVVAVKKLVVEFLGAFERFGGRKVVVSIRAFILRWNFSVRKFGVGKSIFHCEQIGVYKAGLRCEHLSME